MIINAVYMPSEPVQRIMQRHHGDYGWFVQQNHTASSLDLVQHYALEADDVVRDRAKRTVMALFTGGVW